MVCASMTNLAHPSVDPIIPVIGKSGKARGSCARYVKHVKPTISRSPQIAAMTGKGLRG